MKWKEECFVFSILFCPVLFLRAAQCDYCATWLIIESVVFVSTHVSPVAYYHIPNIPALSFPRLEKPQLID